MTKKVLVTGADGFIGSHLVEYLVKKGFDVRAFCCYNSQGSWGWLDTSPPNIVDEVEVILGDIRDPQSVYRAIKGCSVVYNLAALIAIPYSYSNTASYIDTNITGALNVLQAGRDCSVECIVQTSTSEVYGSAQYVPIDEKHPLNGQSPYAATKIGSDQLALSFWQSFETPVTVLRPFNTYGPRQSARAVIPTIISQIKSGAKEIRLGSLSPTRDFNFVTDTCAAFYAVSQEKLCLGETINSASMFEISIGETAQLIAEVLDCDITIIGDKDRIRPKGSEVNRLFGDNSKLKELTSWVPEFSGVDGFRRGLKITSDWFSVPENLSRYRPDIYSI